MTKLLRRQEGFTLIELMVVVLIIGILVAIAIPVFNSTQNNAKRRSCFANERTMEGGIQQFNAEYADHGTPLTGLAQLVGSIVTGGQTFGPWMKADAQTGGIPECPANGAYSIAADGSTVNCTVHGHF